MAVNLSPVGGVAGQFFDNNGDPLVGGKLYTYAAGTTTPQTTYTSSLGTTPNSNPIILNAGGRVPSEIWLTDGLSYKFVLYTSTDQLVGSWDDISGINSNFVNFTSSQEIQTATSGQTVFTLTTMQYQPGTNSLTVYVDGVNQYGPGAQYAYVETNSTTVTFNAGLHVGAEVKFTTVEQATSSATDAASVAYQPAGTGAVTTNVQAKLRETVSVKDFGAVGDGVTDDTAAIQTAVDSGAKEIVFPNGNYIVNSSINFVSKFDILIRGEKANVRAGTNGIVLFDMSFAERCRVTSLRFDGGSNANVYDGNTCTGIRMGLTAGSTNIVEKCTLWNLGKGIQSITHSNTIQDNTIEYCGDAISLVGLSSALVPNWNRISNNNIRRSVNGVYVSTAFTLYGMFVSGNDFEFNGTDINIVNTGGTVLHFDIVNNYFETQADGHVCIDYAAPVQPMRITDNLFTCNLSVASQSTGITAIKQGSGVNQSGTFVGLNTFSTFKFPIVFNSAYSGTLVNNRYANCGTPLLTNATTFVTAINDPAVDNSVSTMSRIGLQDGLTAPSAISGTAVIYVDSADGDLKVIFGNGVVKTIVTDS